MGLCVITAIIRLGFGVWWDFLGGVQSQQKGLGAIANDARGLVGVSVSMGVRVRLRLRTRLDACGVYG